MKLKIVRYFRSVAKAVGIHAYVGRVNSKQNIKHKLKDTWMRKGTPKDIIYDQNQIFCAEYVYQYLVYSTADLWGILSGPGNMVQTFFLD